MESKRERSLKAREDKARRDAARQGYRLEKSRASDPRARTYGTFKIVDADTSAVVFQGSNTAGSGYGLSLDDAEEWLQQEPARAEDSDVDVQIIPGLPDVCQDEGEDNASCLP
jgi:hypothetical protein